MISIRIFLEKQGIPKKSLELISMAEEVGSRFPYVFWGGKNIFGLAKKEEVMYIEDMDGKTLLMKLKNVDLILRKIISQKTDLKAFIEMHIKQRNFFEMEDKSVGIVTSIAKKTF